MGIRFPHGSGLSVAYGLLAVFVTAQKIVVGFPAYDVVLRKTFSEADMVLLTRGVSEPREYQLTAADVQMLTELGERDVVALSTHAPFELKNADMARGIKTKVIDLIQIQQYGMKTVP